MLQSDLISLLSESFRTPGKHSIFSLNAGILLAGGALPSFLYSVADINPDDFYLLLYLQFLFIAIAGDTAANVRDSLATVYPDIRHQGGPVWQAGKTGTGSIMPRAGALADALQLEDNGAAPPSNIIGSIAGKVPLMTVVKGGPLQVGVRTDVAIFTNLNCYVSVHALKIPPTENPLS